MASTTCAMHFDPGPFSSIDCQRLPRCHLSISFWVFLLVVFHLWVSTLMLFSPTWCSSFWLNRGHQLIWNLIRKISYLTETIFADRLCVYSTMNLIFAVELKAKIRSVLSCWHFMIDTKAHSNQMSPNSFKLCCNGSQLSANGTVLVLVQGVCL